MVTRRSRERDWTAPSRPATAPDEGRITAGSDAEGNLQPNRSARFTALLDLLTEHGGLAVSEASAALGVSEATIRRDFNALARQQFVTRTHGGVVAASVAYHLPVRYRGTADDVKERIGAMAAELVKPGDVVAFNGGTTTSATARRVAARADLAQDADRGGITVVTNALNIATEMVLRPHVQTVTLGGMARPQSYELVGPLAVLVLRELWLDHLFLGVEGFDAEAGTTCDNDGKAGVSALMVERASEVTVVAAAEKLGRRTFARICDTRAVSTLVTDKSADPQHVKTLRASGIRVLLA